jgi:hypothetical protein
MLGWLRHVSHLRIHPATWLRGGRAVNTRRSLYVRAGCARCEHALALAQERSVNHGGHAV